MYEEIDNQEFKQEVRPSFLKVLCILSLVSIGLSVLGALGSMISGPQTEESMLADRADIVEANEELRANGMDGLADLFEQIQRMNESLNSNFYAASLVSLIVLGIGLFGVLSMWNGKRLGFHVYIVYSLISVAQLYFFVSPADIPTIAVIFNILISGTFIFMYSRNLGWMK